MSAGKNLCSRWSSAGHWGHKTPSCRDWKSPDRSTELSDSDCWSLHAIYTVYHSQFYQDKIILTNSKPTNWWLKAIELVVSPKSTINRATRLMPQFFQLFQAHQKGPGYPPANSDSYWIIHGLNIIHMADYVRGELIELPSAISKCFAIHQNNPYIKLGVFHELIWGKTQRGTKTYVCVCIYIYIMYKLHTSSTPIYPLCQAFRHSNACTPSIYIYICICIIQMDVWLYSCQPNAYIYIYVL